MNRWLCNSCGHKFNEPDFTIETATLPLVAKGAGEDPSLARGQVVKNKCPSCGSGNLAGSANPDPFTPTKVKVAMAVIQCGAEILARLGYRNIRFVNRQYCGTLQQVYTHGVFYGLDETGSLGRYCFDTEQNATLFLAAWDGKTPPVVGVDGCKAIK